MSGRFSGDDWGVILGGSSGFGLATALKLAAHGMNLCIVHRDRRGRGTGAGGDAGVGQASSGGR